MMVYSPRKSEICLETWLTCENALADISGKTFAGQQKLSAVFGECSDICLGMLQAIRTHSPNTDKIALLCVGICEECAEACETYLFNPLFRKCAEVCRKCADAFSYIASTSIAS